MEEPRGEPEGAAETWQEQLQERKALHVSRFRVRVDVPQQTLSTRVWGVCQHSRRGPQVSRR